MGILATYKPDIDLLSYYTHYTQGGDTYANYSGVPDPLLNQLQRDLATAKYTPNQQEANENKFMSKVDSALQRAVDKLPSDAVKSYSILKDSGSEEKVKTISGFPKYRKTYNSNEFLKEANRWYQHIVWNGMYIYTAGLHHGPLTNEKDIVMLAAFNGLSAKQGKGSKAPKPLNKDNFFDTNTTAGMVYTRLLNELGSHRDKEFKEQLWETLQWYDKNYGKFIKHRTIIPIPEIEADIFIRSIYDTAANLSKQSNKTENKPSVPDYSAKTNTAKSSDPRLQKQYDDWRSKSGNGQKYDEAVNALVSSALQKGVDLSNSTTSGKMAWQQIFRGAYEMVKYGKAPSGVTTNTSTTTTTTTSNKSDNTIWYVGGGLIVIIAIALIIKKLIL